MSKCAESRRASKDPLCGRALRRRFPLRRESPQDKNNEPTEIERSQRGKTRGECGREGGRGHIDLSMRLALPRILIRSFAVRSAGREMRQMEGEEREARSAWEESA